MEVLDSTSAMVLDKQLRSLIVIGGRAAAPAVKFGHEYGFTVTDLQEDYHA